MMGRGSNEERERKEKALFCVRRFFPFAFVFETEEGNCEMVEKFDPMHTTRDCPFICSIEQLHSCTAA